MKSAQLGWGLVTLTLLLGCSNPKKKSKDDDEVAVTKSSATSSSSAVTSSGTLPQLDPALINSALSVASGLIARAPRPKSSSAELDASALAQMAALAESQLTGVEGKTVVAQQPGFKMSGVTFLTGESIGLEYDAPLIAPEGQQYWVTVVAKGVPDSQYGAWHYVAPGAKTDSVKAPAPGDYEIRLHDFYPQFSYRVIARQQIAVVQCKVSADCANADCENGVCVGLPPVPVAPPPPPPPPPPPVPTPPPVAANVDQYGYLPDGWPAIITAPSTPPPTTQEWASVPRETTVKGSSRLVCQTKMLDEWFRVSCRKNGYGVPVDVSHQASYGQQAYKFLATGSVASIVVQMIPGKNYEAMFTWQDERGADTSFTLTATWQSGRPRAWFDVPN